MHGGAERDDCVGAVFKEFGSGLKQLAEMRVTKRRRMGWCVWLFVSR